jgi:alcohol dehydrogenase class IV
MGCCHHYQFSAGGDDLFTVDVNRIRFGPGALRELGAEVSLEGVKSAAVFTDSVVSQLELFSEALQSLRAAGVVIEVYDEVRVEPTDQSFQEASQFAGDYQFDGFVSIGGGSVIDTCKAANLFSSHPADFLAYVNAPLGEGRAVPGALKPHIACPTTSGTGSECTGIAVFDLLENQSKTGIMSRYLLPNRAIVDPRWTAFLPAQVVAATGFDVISHALEVFTARPYTARPQPDGPALRPMTQGANPWSDMVCQEAMRQAGKYLVRAVRDPADETARQGMMYAATLSGVAFGNGGCHLPHAMSYPVAGMVRNFQPHGYPTDEPICPHGMSVTVNAPAAYRFTSAAAPERHFEGAALLGADTADAVPAEAGDMLAEHLADMMKQTDMPNGIGGVGFDGTDIDDLVTGALVQQRLLSVSPREVHKEDLRSIYSAALRYW